MARRKVRRKKETPLLAEYRRQRRRVQSFVRRAEKRGFIFQENIVPAIPKRITQASVRRLAKLTPEYLYGKAEYVSRETGEILPSSIGRKLSRQMARTLREAQREQRVREESSRSYGFFEDVIISNFSELISHFNSRGGQVLHRWLDQMISEHGKHNVAVMLQEAARNNKVIDYKAVYDFDALVGRLGEMMSYLPDVYQEGFYVDEIIDSMEEMWLS